LALGRGAATVSRAVIEAADAASRDGAAAAKEGRIRKRAARARRMGFILQERIVLIIARGPVGRMV
jgi:hypothetical protein